MKYILDNCLPRGLSRVLSAVDNDNEIVHLQDDGRFRCDTDDITIIRALAAERPRPVWLTADTAQARDPNTRKALAESELTVVFFKKGFNNLPIAEQAIKIIKAWTGITKAVEKCKEPTAFEVATKSAKVCRLCRTCDL